MDKKLGLIEIWKTKCHNVIDLVYCPLYEWFNVEIAVAVTTFIFCSVPITVLVWFLPNFPHDWIFYFL